MSDVTDAVFQQQVADSILEDDNIIATMTHEGQFIRPEDSPSDAEHGESVFDDPADYFAETLYEQEHDAQKLGDDGLRDLLRREGQQVEDAPEELSEEERLLSQEERIRRKLESEPQEQEADEEPPQQGQAEQAQPQEETQPLTLEVFQEQMQGLESFVKENQLTSGEGAAVFPHELAGAFGATPETAGIDPQGVIDFSAKAVVSGLREIDLGTYSQEMPELAAREAGFQACKFLGHDPRGEGVNLVSAGRTVRELTNNILLTIAMTGSADPEKVNTRENIERYFGQLQNDLGSARQISFSVAKKVADAYVRRVSSAIEQLRQNRAHEAQSQERPVRPRKSGQRIPRGLAPGIKGGKVQTFETNQEIFDPATMRTHAMRRL